MNKSKLIIYILLILTLPYVEYASASNLNIYCRCNDITPVKLWNADSWLWLNSNDKDVSIEKHLPWGKPTNTSVSTNEKL